MKLYEKAYDIGLISKKFITKFNKLDNEIKKTKTILKKSIQYYKKPKQSGSKLLLDKFGIYIQPVFYPTVPKGDERLRVTITPKHSKKDINSFVNSINEAWNILGLDRVEEQVIQN